MCTEDGDYGLDGWLESAYEDEYMLDGPYVPDYEVYELNQLALDNDLDDGYDDVDGDPEEPYHDVDEEYQQFGDTYTEAPVELVPGF